MLNFPTNNCKIEASSGAGRGVSEYKHDRLWVRFPLQEKKYLIFSLPRFVNEEYTMCRVKLKKY